MGKWEENFQLREMRASFSSISRWVTVVKWGLKWKEDYWLVANGGLLEEY